MSLTIDQMRLNPVARAGAVTLLSRCPSVVFTSGRRDRWKQAEVMAQNSALNRRWVGSTYLHAAAFQTWLDLHQEARTVEQIAHGFYTLMASMSDAELGAVSKHLGGNAFDVLPMVMDFAGTPTEAGHNVIEVVRSLDGLEKFLTKEGGLVRWHCQFDESEEV